MGFTGEGFTDARAVGGSGGELVGTIWAAFGTVASGYAAIPEGMGAIFPLSSKA